MATISVPKKGHTSPAGVWVAGLLALAGLGAWVYQLSAGLGVTGLTQQVGWGLYISAFFTAVGAGAGLLALAGVSEFVPVLPEKSRPLSLGIALASFVVGGLLITLDIGNPLQVWRIISGFRFSSLMTWDFWLLAVAGVVALVYLLTTRRGGGQKALGALGIVAATAVVAVEGWMLSSLAAHPLWGSGFTLVSFLAGAAIAGLGMAMAAGLGTDELQGWLKLALGLGLVLALAETLSGLVAGQAEAVLVLAGFAAPAFWLQVAAGLLLPLFLLARKSTLWLAGVLAVVGVVAEKVWMLAAGQAKPWLDLPQGVYFPTWVELVAVAGLAAIGVLAYQLLKVIFKLK